MNMPKFIASCDKQEDFFQFKVAWGTTLLLWIDLLCQARIADTARNYRADTTILHHGVLFFQAAILAPQNIPCSARAVADVNFVEQYRHRKPFSRLIIVPSCACRELDVQPVGVNAFVISTDILHNVHICYHARSFARVRAFRQLLPQLQTASLILFAFFFRIFAILVGIIFLGTFHRRPFPRRGCFQSKNPRLLLIPSISVNTPRPRPNPEPPELPPPHNIPPNGGGGVFDEGGVL